MTNEDTRGGRARETLPADAPLPELVMGRQPSPPATGFGQLWRKEYRAWFRSALSPEAILRDWEAYFDDLWPSGQRFYAPASGIRPGRTAVARLRLSGLPLVAGLKVVDTTPDSFTLGTAEGHMFAGIIRFGVRREGSRIAASIEATVRSSDPLYEAGLMAGGHRREDAFWRQTLRRVARRYGTFERMKQQTALVDRRRRWQAAGNVRHNAAILTPLKSVSQALRRQSGA